MFNGTITGRGLADLMVGAVGSLEHGVPNLLVMDMTYIGLYGAGRVAPGRPRDIQLRRCAGSRTSASRCSTAARHIFNHDNFVEGREEQGVRQRAGRAALPGRRRLPAGQERVQREVAGRVAAPRPCVGRDWRRPPGVPDLVRTDLRLPERRLHEHQRVGAAMGQPLAHHARRSSTIRTRSSAATRIRSRPTPTRFPGVRRVRRDGSEHQPAARAVVERDAREAARDELVGDGRTTSAATRITSGRRKRSTRACSWVSARARSTASRTRCAARSQTSISAASSRSRIRRRARCSASWTSTTTSAGRGTTASGSRGTRRSATA